MPNIADSIGAEGLLAGASLLSRPADEFGNDPTVEAMWAMRAMDHADVYFNLLCSVDPTLLRLTPHDNEIYSAFRLEFPDMRVDRLDEQTLKSDIAKEIWRPFCEHFKLVVEDYSFGTLLRLDSAGEYSEANSTLVPRIQFLAIELARNREGANSPLRKTYRNRAKSQD